ncbi:hypothetical protein J2W28_001003 [Variovorax boronicumulans]|uniref:hypothetical protein n=1 Tax=Variovorax boronicumulans TaxID=436515 RepID=UPI002787A6AA|nr:hypothetical protein [Variovorax boronicumulans]MDP9991975.1 hypothetical protein [Variovorax boronicumulans]MDQ0001870.1 hypothetical protein [Variovorax boronicumulans]
MATLLRQSLGSAKSALRRALAVAMSALVWFLLCGAAGMALVVAGVAVLFGTGWALIAAGAFLIFTAALIGRGMKHGSA